MEKGLAMSRFVINNIVIDLGEQVSALKSSFPSCHLLFCRASATYSFPPRRPQYPMQPGAWPRRFLVRLVGQLDPCRNFEALWNASSPRNYLRSLRTGPRLAVVASSGAACGAQDPDLAITMPQS